MPIDKTMLILVVIVLSYLFGTVNAASVTTGWSERYAVAQTTLKDVRSHLGQCEASLSGVQDRLEAVLEETLAFRQKKSIASFSMATLIAANPWLCGADGNLGTTPGSVPSVPAMLADLDLASVSQ